MNGSVSGVKYIDTLDCDDPEYQREMMRPVDVKEDVRQMEQRRRVQLILNSRAFRDELEDIVVDQQILGSPSTNDPVVSIQRLSEIIVPRFARLSSEDGIGPCLPINDHNNSDALLYGGDELSFRCKVASLYRIFDMHGWTHSSKCSISGRLGQGVERFLVAPFGLPSNEVTASSLVRIDMRGDIIETPKPSSMQTSVPQNKPQIDKNSFLLHSALYASRPDIRCVAFLSNKQAICISALKKGLVPISREAAALGDVGHFTYNGCSLNLEQRDKLRRIMGHSTKIVCVSNFGVLVAGESVEETYDLAESFIEAADFQLKQARLGNNSSVKNMSEEERKSIFYEQQMAQEDRDGNIWKRGELRYQTFMKQFDNFGYKTGYPYKGGKVAVAGLPNNTSSSPALINNTNLKFETQMNRVNEAHNETRNTSNSNWAPSDASTPLKPNSNSEILSHHTVIDQTFTSKQKVEVVSPSSPPQKSFSSMDGEVISPNKKKKKGFLSFSSKKKEKSTDCDSALIPLLCVHG